MTQKKSNGWALFPLLLFLAIFIGSGIWFTVKGQKFAFYQISATVAILPAIVLAVFMGKAPINKKIQYFISGVGDSNIIIMCLIYLLAGAFSSVAKEIGAVESTVNLALHIIPSFLILPGLFITAAFIATAMGTSMGTIAAIAPIAVGLTDKTGMAMSLTVATVVGGAMFGDNLSMISDTTIAATKTQGVHMKDKFRFNLMIALPAAFITLLILFFMGSHPAETPTSDFQFIKVVPYLLILIMAGVGVNVFAVLFSGIVFAGIVGFYTVDTYTLVKFSQDIYSGFTSMQEIMILSLLIGGLGELIHRNGGIEFIIVLIKKITAKFSKKEKSRIIGEIGIFTLASLADICVANNTVAIIITGKMAKEIAEENGVDLRRSASLLDISSCVFQGLLPYSAQILLAGSIAKISPVKIVGQMYYCYILGIVALLAIILGIPDPEKKFFLKKKTTKANY